MGICPAEASLDTTTCLKEPPPLFLSSQQPHSLRRHASWRNHRIIAKIISINETHHHTRTLLVSKRHSKLPTASMKPKNEPFSSTNVSEGSLFRVVSPSICSVEAYTVTAPLLKQKSFIPFTTPKRCNPYRILDPCHRREGDQHFSEESTPAGHTKTTLLLDDHSSTILRRYSISKSRKLYSTIQPIDQQVSQNNNTTICNDKWYQRHTVMTSPDGKCVMLIAIRDRERIQSTYKVELPNH